MTDDIFVRRKSVRNYSAQKFSDALKAEIADVIKSLRPMFDDASTYFKLVPEDLVRNELSGSLVSAPYYIIISSDAGDGVLENAGFMAEQLVLELTDRGIGTCYCGMAKAKKSSSISGEYGITVALGYPAEKEKFRNSESDFKRKDINKILIGDKENDFFFPYIRAARLAPSAVNKQPVVYEMNTDSVDIYRKKNALAYMERMQKIDSGIAAAHIYCLAKIRGMTVDFYKKGTDLREKLIYVISLNIVEEKYE